MESLYEQIYDLDNLNLAWIKAKKGKTKKRYVKRFGKNLEGNLLELQKELKEEIYSPRKLKNFVLRDPKTRKISKSAFRDRVIHHALCNIITPLFEKSFIYDPHANQIGKGTHKALERLDKFKRKVSKNNTQDCYVLKADIKHYFEDVNHEVLIKILDKKIKDEKVIWLIRQVLENFRERERERSSPNKGMPLGNLTSQFFANVYLNELDQFVKHALKVKYYIRYVDDFVMLHKSKEQLEIWKNRIDNFLNEELKIMLHPNKSQILKLEKGIKFLGFRVFYHHKLIRKSNLNDFDKKFNQMKFLFNEGFLTREKVFESIEGWMAYARHGNTYKYRRHIIRKFSKLFPYEKGNGIRNKSKFQNFIKKVNESELDFSAQKTLFLFVKGKTISEIAKDRCLKEDTVWSHLARLIEHKQIPLVKVLSKDKIYKILSKVYSRKDKLKDVKKRLKNENITYNEMECVMASIKSRGKYKSPS